MIREFVNTFNFTTYFGKLMKNIRLQHIYIIVFPKRLVIR